MALSDADKRLVVEYQIHCLQEDKRIPEQHRTDLLRCFREVQEALGKGTLTEDAWGDHLLRWRAYQVVATTGPSKLDPID